MLCKANHSEAYAALQLSAPQPQPLPVARRTPPADDRDYNANPLRFLVHGREVPLGRSSAAARPAPGAERAATLVPRPYEGVTGTVNIPPAIIDDTIIKFGEDMFVDLPKLRDGDWSEYMPALTDKQPAGGWLIVSH